MEIIGLIAPITFVFAIAGLSLAGKLKKDVEELKNRIDQLSTEMETMKKGDSR